MTATPPLCLVVDDNQLNTGLAGHMLQRLGWRSLIATRGEDALRRLTEQSVDLVLLDLRMPEMTGEEVCRSIREDLRLTQLPVVAYTAHGMPEERERMLQAGFSGLLVKPVSLQDLRAVCDDALSGRGGATIDGASA